MKALYEGMDLYDQGRYAEAWLRFRQASRQDRQYVEAQYWVGKMYYFMDRYEHARLALERFVYLDAAHPRLGDAIVEYVHTYEKLDTAAETLLALYQGLAERYPEGLVWATDGTGARTEVPLRTWTVNRRGALLMQLGRYEEALALGLFEGRLARHAVTGAPFEASEQSGWFFFEGSTEPQERRRTFDLPPKVAGQARRRADPWKYRGTRDREEVLLHLCAPPGYAFQAVRVCPEVKGGEAEAGAILVPYGVEEGTRGDPPPGRRRGPWPAAEAGRDGFRWDRPGLSGLLRARLWIAAQSPDSDTAALAAVRVAATLTGLVNPGALDVWCDGASGFYVEVDGALARQYAGLVGPLSEGTHTVTFLPQKAESPYRPWSTEATVRPGQVTRVVGRLQWKPDSPWQTWQASSVGPEYAGHQVEAYAANAGPPAVLAEESGLRLVWSYGGDLWWSASADGAAFSAPQKVPLPVSSGWLEIRPKLLRDRSGRFILTFLSDRDGRHVLKPYLSWSRDFVRWTAPALISDRYVSVYDLIEDAAGRLVWIQTAGTGQTVRASSDGYRWETLSEVKPSSRATFRMGRAIVQRDDGRCEVFVSEVPIGVPEGQGTARVVRYLSTDACQWTAPEAVAEFPYGSHVELLSAAHHKGRTIVLGHGRWRCMLLGETAGGEWRRSAMFPGMLTGVGSIASSPRWGLVIAWCAWPTCGPYVVRSPDAEAFFDGAPGKGEK
jgi:hypothetical protein